MKKLYYFIVLLTGAFVIQSCNTPPSASPEAIAAFESVIPKPVSATHTGNAFLITDKTTVIADPSAMEVGNYLVNLLRPATGFNLPLSESKDEASSGAIVLSIIDNKSLGDEGYELAVTTEQVTISANKPAGLFYGVQTLRQILPAAIEQSAVQTATWEIATGTITDHPEYTWRGSMLDVARHFFSVADVKRYIDLISLYKMNVLHLHLSDDQGWRIEIKSWPNLATHGGSTQVGGGAGGYYTQEQYAGIVAYAQARFITIVPEIDMPGHINSALASYGELNGGITIVPAEGRIDLSPKTSVIDGKSKPTQLYTGTEVGFSTLQLKKEATFKFVDDVIRELSALTPGPYIHIGGDEASVTKKEEYIVFINRFNEIVKSHGKRMIGWDEIAQGTIDSTVTVQLWHSEEFGQLAVEKGSRLVMSPAKKVYLDMQYDSATRLGLHWAAYIEVADSYNWDPATLIDGVAKENIVGIEAPLWSETIVTMDDIEYMIFPRLPGIAEIGWTTTANRSWEEYKVRLAKHAPRWKVMGIDYYPSTQVPWAK
ncbi:MAG: beta-N-acetylhexosaminidase [Cyclobacteriaceae bacterium]|nr:beta-N-acetylhexosaminidase [Cyclobacteriaceae bacterium]